MTKDEPDFRAMAMNTPEGLGIARGRYDDFMDRNLETMVDSFLDWDNPPAGSFGDQEDRVYDEFVADAIAESAREDADLIGFWVAWHLGGGFEQLERGGWHRATLYRRAHRFRVRYGQHPDEYDFPFIKLDRKAYWTEQVRRSLAGPAEAPDEAFG